MLGWINPNDYSFNSFLLLERFQIRLMFQLGGWRVNKEEWKSKMGIALNANPAVGWYFEKRCPECASAVKELAANAPEASSTEEIREAEVFALAGVEDFITYTTPEVM
ncbi:MAG: class I SAM-dependent methyltransferase, partial [Oscillospiraceae bacterium]|nr:class I SAM-dependent methyltransferase [Oscillospiraceae bacterium]